MAIAIQLSTSERITSKLIEKITGEGVSHISLRCGDFIFHSTGSHGIEVCSVRAFLDRGNQIRYMHWIEGDQDTQLRHLLSFYCERKRVSSMYDYLCLITLGLKLLLRLKKVPILQVSGNYDCVEYVSKFILGKEMSEMTPLQLYTHLTTQENLKQ
jgi:hypothetical protein